MGRKIVIVGAGAVGGYAGGQAQYARVPYADTGPLKIDDGLAELATWMAGQEADDRVDQAMDGWSKVFDFLGRTIGK